jgi:hypothetical protein
MKIEIPASVEQQAITNAAAAGFADVGQYVVSLIVTDSPEMQEAGGVPEEALSDPYYEELVIAGLNSGAPTPLTKDDFDEIRNEILQRHLKK